MLKIILLVMVIIIMMKIELLVDRKIIKEHTSRLKETVYKEFGNRKDDNFKRSDLNDKRNK